MTKCKCISWAIWAVLVLAMLMIAACGNDGPVAPPGQTQLADLIWVPGGDTGAAYEELRAAGGGTRIVDTEPYALIGVFNRWTGANLHGLILVRQADGTTNTYTVSSYLPLSDLDYPITVNAWVDGYASATIVNTNANVLAFGLEPFAWGYDSMPMYGLCSTDLLDEGCYYKWRTLGISTQNNQYSSTTNGGPNSNPYTIVQINPFRPAGVATFLFGLLPTPAGGVDGLSPETADEYGVVGYAYDSLSVFAPGMTGAWVMDMQPVDSLNAYTEGTYTIDPTIQEDILHGCAITFTGGTGLADSWEFVPNTLPELVKPDSGSGTYTVEGVDPVATGGRNAIRAAINYSVSCSIASGTNWLGASEIVFADWDPSGDTLPDIDFAAVPVLTNVAYSPVDYYMTVAWTNETAEGIQVLDVTWNGSLLWRVYIDSASTELPEDTVLVSPFVGPFITTVNAALTRINCPGISLDTFDCSTIWTDAASFATSPVMKLVPQGTPY